MAKEWILNSAMNRWQLNFKRNVGAVSEEIRKCAPKTAEDWEQHYYTNIYPKSHLEDLGRRLYVKTSEVLPKEIESVTEEDCVSYIREGVVNRTYDGYTTEIQTIYGQLEEALGVEIKPVGHAFITQIHKEQKIQAGTHAKFNELFGGPVFYVYSVKDGKKKKIYNREVIAEIRDAAERYSRA